jgi:mannose-6-phosphate isomerase-like protein (cupin superfamily)
MKHMHCADVESYDASALGLEGAEKWKVRLLSENAICNELEPGGFTPAEHTHDDIERGVVISGKGIIKLRNNEIEIKPNDFFEFSDENHQFINNGNEPLVFLCFRFPR